jgi:trimethylguanosine synthase
LPDGDCGDGITNPFPKDEVPDKFWSQRRRLFTRFDEGVQLDKESWYSVTPEAIANHIAASMVANEQEHVTILDMFCGCGGNAIAFAQRAEVQTVVCVDSDMGKLKKAAHNAKCYGIAREKMIFIHSGACEVLSCYDGGELSRASDRQEECPPSLENHSSDSYKFGGLNLLPSAIDMAFVSPPWVSSILLVRFVSRITTDLIFSFTF